MRSQILAVALAACCVACSNDAETVAEEPKDGPPAGEPVPEFLLEDTNATSPTFGQTVSPRHHLDKISAWFFGHAT